jgi:hypothetical protein
MLFNEDEFDQAAFMLEMLDDEDDFECEDEGRDTMLVERDSNLLKMIRKTLLSSKHSSSII